MSKGYGPTPKDLTGDVVLQTNGDYSKILPTYVDYEDIFAALEQVRKANLHGYGYNKPVKVKVPAAPAPSGGAAPSGGTATATPAAPPKEETQYQLQANMSDSANPSTKGYKKEGGNGAPIPYVVEEYPAGTPPKTRVVGGGDLKRSNCVTATFNALSIALARGLKDASGNYTPYTRNGRLNMDAYRRWFAIDSRDDGVQAMVMHNLGVKLAYRKTRRGDVVQINWQGGGSHCTYCWDSLWDGEQIFIQAISSQLMTNGVDVVPSLEEYGAFSKSETVIQSVELTESKSNVISRSRTTDWLTTYEAREHFRRFGAFLREHGDSKKFDTGLMMDNFSAGRLHRLFPRYPIALGGSVEVSTVQGGHEDDVQHHRTRESSSQLYFDDNESDKGEPRKGGFFPIGSSRTWHGGIHLYPEKDDDGVRAPVDGVLVAARLTTDKNRSEYGDTGFVLIKTRLKVDDKEIAFFTLLAHLRAPTEDEHEQVSWLEEMRRVPGEDDHRWTRKFDKKKFYYGVLDAPTEALTDEGRKGDAEDGSLIFFKSEDTSSKKLGTFAKGDVVEILWPLQYNGWAKVKALDGDLAGQEGWIHAAGRVERVATHLLDEKLKDARKKLFDGEVVDFSKLEQKIVVRVGELVGHVGSVGGEKAIHFAIFSKDMIEVNFAADHAADGKKTKPDIEDTDANLYMDRSKFEKRFFDLFHASDEGGGGDSSKGAPPQKHFMIKGSTRKDDDQLLGDEVRQFFAKNPLRKNMRTMVTRHHSEWGDQVDWSQLQSQPQWQHLDATKKQHYKDESKKLVWWTSGLGKDADLPDDQICHHYHPIEFLKWLDFEREQDTKGTLHASVFELNHGG